MRSCNPTIVKLSYRPRDVADDVDVQEGEMGYTTQVSDDNRYLAVRFPRVECWVHFAQVEFFVVTGATHRVAT